MRILFLIAGSVPLVLSMAFALIGCRPNADITATDVLPANIEAAVARSDVIAILYRNEAKIADQLNTWVVREVLHGERPAAEHLASTWLGLEVKDNTALMISGTDFPSQSEFTITDAPRWQRFFAIRGAHVLIYQQQSGEERKVPLDAVRLKVRQGKGASSRDRGHAGQAAGRGQTTILDKSMMIQTRTEASEDKAD
ncbi:MAG: hypothetical protein ABL962_07770 [Fimbriimonadaceae bacterium]